MKQNKEKEKCTTSVITDVSNKNLHSFALGIGSSFSLSKEAEDLGFKINQFYHAPKNKK